MTCPVMCYFHKGLKAYIESRGGNECRLYSVGSISKSHCRRSYRIRCKMLCIFQKCNLIRIPFTHSEFYSLLWFVQMFLINGIAFPILVKSYTSFKTQLKHHFLCDISLLSHENKYFLLPLKSLLSILVSQWRKCSLFCDSSYSYLPLKPSSLAIGDR
jgi:hypothetical protein